MQRFNPICLVKIQNFITSSNIDALIKKFIKSKNFEEDPPYDLDIKAGIITYYDPDKDEYYEVKFVDKLNDILWNLANELKTEIDVSNTLLNVKERNKYWRTIFTTFNYIKETNLGLIRKFPVCLKPEEEIKKFLATKYNFDQPSQFDEDSFFRLKPKYKTTDLENIYEFITDNLFLDDELYSFEDFYAVLNDKDTKKQLVFNCKTQTLVCILNKLSNLFTNFSR